MILSLFAQIILKDSKKDIEGLATLDKYFLGSKIPACGVQLAWSICLDDDQET